VHFRRPGKTNLYAKFTITLETLEMLVRETEKGNGRFDWNTTVEIKDDTGNLVALVEKVIYLKKKSIGQDSAQR
jgi:hypothetical protein